MTLNELYIAALVKLGAVPVGSSAAPEDIQVVEAKYDQVYQMLLTEGLVSWAQDEAIPDFAAMPLTSMLAHACCREFPSSGVSVGELMLEGAIGLSQPSLAERQLRKQLAGRYVSSPAQPDYF
jgi:hypothetical protein